MTSKHFTRFLIFALLFWAGLMVSFLFLVPGAQAASQNGPGWIIIGDSTSSLVVERAVIPSADSLWTAQAQRLARVTVTPIPMGEVGYVYQGDRLKTLVAGLKGVRARGVIFMLGAQDWHANASPSALGLAAFSRIREAQLAGLQVGCILPIPRTGDTTPNAAGLSLAPRPSGQSVHALLRSICVSAKAAFIIDGRAAGLTSASYGNDSGIRWNLNEQGHSTLAQFVASQLLTSGWWTH